MIHTEIRPFTPKYKPNQVFCGTGKIAIVTGWSVRDTVKKKLKPDQYAVIGNLYSPTRGINFLIRNLLFNPQVRYSVGINATKEDRNSGSVACLLDFFRYGFRLGKSDLGKDCWVINSEIAGYIDLEVDCSALEELRKNVIFSEAKTINEAIDRVHEYLNDADYDKLEPWSKPLEFPLIETTSTTLPTNRYGHRIEGKTIAETWVKIIHRIKTTGTIRPTGYDGNWQELIDLMAVVTDEPENFYFPEPNYLPISPDFIKEYVSQILTDTPYVEGVKYTYAQRLRSWFGHDQIEEVIGKLVGEIDAASAVMNLWDSGGNLGRRVDGSSDHQHSGSPCLNHIWVRIIDNEISLTATLRSNDMFSAWAANAMGLRALQRYIKDGIEARSNYKLVMGPLITISESAHIYDDTFESVDRIIKEHYHAIVGKERLTFSDPVGNFLIEVECGEIIINQTTPGSGEIVAQYRGKNPLNLIRKICSVIPAIRPDHAAYLGIELEKAFDCTKSDRPYKQDC